MARRKTRDGIQGATMGEFQLNRKFKRDYDKLFKKDPLGANTFLLLCEMADKNGQVVTDPEELSALLVARFNDPYTEYALLGGEK